METGSRSRLQKLTGVIFQTLVSPRQAQEYCIFCGDLSDRTVPPVYQTGSGYTLRLVDLLVFGSPIAVYLNLQSKVEDRDEKMAVKCSSGDWCSLEEAIFGHTSLPVCLHHIRGPQTLPVQLGHTGRVDIRLFIRIPLIRLARLYLKLLVGSIKISLLFYYLKVNIV